MTIETAVILSAGLGTRMRPLSEDTPKPLLTLEGEPILAHIIAQLREAGVRRFLVNAHYKAEQVEAFLRDIPGAEMIYEPELLETGGAVAAMRAQGKLGEGPVLVVNGDAYWVDGPIPMLKRLERMFVPARHDALLLLARTAGTPSETRQGDFAWPTGGALTRRREREVAPYVYAGVQIIAPALLDYAPGGAQKFSFNLLWDAALAAGRLSAMVHDGVWFHLSTPDDLEAAQAVLATREVGNST
jgi:MurNAc alpha-1-phosphate uridylyltransferase